MMHGVRLESGVWVVNLHASTRGAAGEPQTRAESLQAAGTALGWAGGAPLVLGGDFNLRGTPELPGLRHVAGHYVDHVYVSRIERGRARRGARPRNAVRPRARGRRPGSRRLAVA